MAEVTDSSVANDRLCWRRCLTKPTWPTGKDTCALRPRSCPLSCERRRPGSNAARCSTGVFFGLRDANVSTCNVGRWLCLIWQKGIGSRGARATHTHRAFVHRRARTQKPQKSRSTARRPPIGAEAQQLKCDRAPTYSLPSASASSSSAVCDSVTHATARTGGRS